MNNSLLKLFLISSIFLPMSIMAIEVQNSLIDDKSPEFLLGKATRRGLLIRSQDNPEMSLSLGARMQGTVEARQVGDAWLADVYGRRIRFEVTANFSKRFSYVMDLRNDQANRADGGEKNFIVGNAYIQVRELFGLPFINFQGFRGKIDVTRATTVSSGQQLYYERPFVAEYAQQYVSHNRRAANLQIFGSYEGKIRYSLAVGDAVSCATFFDARSRVANSIAKQDPMFGAKIIFSPINGWEEKERTSTYFGRGKHASLGAGYFRANSILFKPTATTSEQRVDRGLLNIETSFLYGPLFIQAEYLNFTGMIEDFNETTLVNGDSNGWYVTGEYVLSDYSYLAPTFRYEKWNRFRQKLGYTVESAVLGVNWYLMGNSTRAGLMLQRDWLGSKVGSGIENSVRLISQIHF